MYFDAIVRFILEHNDFNDFIYYFWRFKIMNYSYQCQNGYSFEIEFEWIKIQPAKDITIYVVPMKY